MFIIILVILYIIDHKNFWIRRTKGCVLGYKNKKMEVDGNMPVCEEESTSDGFVTPPLSEYGIGTGGPGFSVGSVPPPILRDSLIRLKLYSSIVHLREALKAACNDVPEDGNGGFPGLSTEIRRILDIENNFEFMGKFISYMEEFPGALSNFVDVCIFDPLVRVSMEEFADIVHSYTPNVNGVEKLEKLLMCDETMPHAERYFCGDSSVIGKISNTLVYHG